MTRATTNDDTAAISSYLSTTTTLAVIIAASLARSCCHGDTISPNPFPMVDVCMRTDDICLIDGSDGQICQEKSNICAAYTCLDNECILTSDPNKIQNDCLCGKCVEDCGDSPTCFDFCEDRIPPSVLYLSRTDRAAGEMIVQWKCKGGQNLNETVYITQHPVLGEVFELKKPSSCLGGNSNLSPFFHIYYDGSRGVEFHTSCSYPMHNCQQICDDFSFTDPSYCLPLYITGFCNERGDEVNPPVENSACGYISRSPTISVSRISTCGFITTATNDETASPTPEPTDMTIVTDSLTSSSVTSSLQLGMYSVNFVSAAAAVSAFWSFSML